MITITNDTRKRRANHFIKSLKKTILEAIDAENKDVKISVIDRPNAPRYIIRKDTEDLKIVSEITIFIYGHENTNS